MLYIKASENSYCDPIGMIFLSNASLAFDRQLHFDFEPY